MKYKVSEEPSKIQIAYWKALEQDYHNAIAKIKERIANARTLRRRTVLRPSVKIRRAMLFAIIQENKKFLSLLEGTTDE